MDREREQEEPISFVIDNMQICVSPHPNVRCYHCKHQFLPDEEYVLIRTSGGGRRYRAHYSKFCLTCIIKGLLADTDYIESFLQARDKAKMIAKENQANQEKGR